MASVQEAEVQFAQRLASNERPVRTKALRKLRKYINVRSQKAAGGFTGDELLKLWKGLFYCLWMQDKLLLQEELSNKISSLIHSFQDVDGQFFYLESFLQTFKREWTGIDRLRMDKFFQLIRFMFRQTFEMLKRKNWESSVVSRFLELLTAQLLQSSSEAPSGLQFHILDLYMTELAAVGSAELTAEQNLKFIEPFCKTAAKTKDRTLFGAICSSIFSTIIDQAPFAIEDLMKELKAAEASDRDSDSGQASEEDDGELGEKSRKPVDKKGTGKQINGNESEEEEEEEEEEEDDLLHLEDSDTEAPCDEDVGPVLQFDYGALADKLLELSSRSSTPGKSRQRLYSIIKVLRNLSRGIFPRDEYPEEVSTDEDDDMFCSRKRMKRRGGHMGKDGEGAPASKKRKGNKKEASALDKQNKDSAKDEGKPADLTANKENKKKKRKKRKKKKKAGEAGENAEVSEMEQVAAQSTIKEGDDQRQSSVSSVRVTESITPEGQSETLLLSEVKKQPSVTVTEESSDPAPGSKEQSEFKKKTSELKLAEEPETSRTEPEMSSDAGATVSGKKKKKKKGQTGGIVLESQVSAEAEVAPPESDATAASKKKRKNAEKNLQEVNGVSAEDGSATVLQTDSTTTGKKKSKKKNLKANEAAEFEAGGKHTDPEITSAGEELSPDATAVPPVKKKKNKCEETAVEASHAADESTETALKKKRKKSQEESKKPTVNKDGTESEAPRDAEAPLINTTTPAKKKKKKPSSAKDDEVKDQTQVVGTEDAELPLEETGKPVKRRKMKRKVPVVFEFEADELQAAASINGLAEEKLDAGEPSTPLSSKNSQMKAKTSGSDFITFLNNAAVPTPLFCKTKGGPSTPLSSKKKRRTPKSESKKVTFGLKNNKTAEFKKTDRSLLVSPDGSSRVPFDPKQKPKFGVLKSPSTPLATKIRKTPKKIGPKTPKSTPKKRPSAADFF